MEGKKMALVFEARNTDYRIADVRRPMTVKDLMEILEDMDGDTPIIISHDRGYTYGTLSNPRALEGTEDPDYEGGYEWTEV